MSEIERRLAQQALIAEFGRFALGNQNLDGILTEACRLAADGLEVRFAKVLRHMPAENAFLLQAGIGWKKELIGKALIAADLDSPAGYAFKTGEAVISNHLTEEMRFRTPDILVEHGINRAVNVMVYCESGSYGVLEVDSRDKGAFTAHDVNFIQALANTLGVAIDKERYQSELEKLVNQKELLLVEIDHRVKNSLALVSGLLSMQERTVESPEAKAALAAASGRLMSIARVHERLHRSVDAGAIAFHTYLKALCVDLAASLGRVEDVDIEVTSDSIDTSINRAVSLGLITAELVTNALKYAKHASGRSSIKVTCVHDEGHIVLTVADNGPGLPDGFDEHSSHGMGMRVVHSLVRHLHGNFEAATVEGGALFRIKVALADPLRTS